MMIKLYHGSNVRVEKPDLHKSKPYKDFGQGFYLSDDKQQAWDIAYSKVAQLKTGKAMVSTFLFDDSVILSNELNIKIFNDYSEEWARFILMNRDKSELQPSHNFDIVYGPIADDGVTFQLRRFWGGVISIEKLIEELKYAKRITFQYYFGTENALNKLCYDTTE